MEINLFSQCIKELIVENDRVDVPYLGTFSAEMMPATYSDRQTTIDPPYRKMSFHKQPVSLEEGRLLLNKVCELAGVSMEQAGVELGWCLSRLSSELEGRKICKLPGLGVMRANARNEYYFVPDDKLDIWPDGIGFEPVSMKLSEKVEAAGSDSGADASERFGVSHAQRGSLSETPESSTGQPTTAPESELMPEVKPEVKSEVKPEVKPKLVEFERVMEPDPEPVFTLRTIRLILIVLLVLVVLFIVASYLFTDAMSPILDRLLYTREELELLRR